MPWQPKSKPKRAPKTVRKVLADGSVKVYEYARGKKAPEPRERDTIAMLIQAYQSSPEWRRLADATKDRYARYLRHLQKIGTRKAGEFTRREVGVIRAAIDETGKPAAANAFVQSVSAMYDWGMKNDWVVMNPAMRIKPLPGGHFAAWTPEATTRALGQLPDHLRRLVLLALYTGQRRGDLCRLGWSNYDGQRIRLTQGKTKTPLVIPVHPVLKAAMDTWERKATTVLVNALGRPWKPATASTAMKIAVDRLGLPEGWNIHGLRKLAAANLAVAGCSAMEVAAITGHRSLSMVELYTRSADQEMMATAAIVRLQTGGKR